MNTYTMLRIVAKYNRQRDYTRRLIAVVQGANRERGPMPVSWDTLWPVLNATEEQQSEAFRYAMLGINWKESA